MSRPGLPFPPLFGEPPFAPLTSPYSASSRNMLGLCRASLESPIFQMGKTEAQNALGACPGSPRERPCSSWGLARGTVGLGREGQLSLGQGVPSESCWWRACWQGHWAEPRAPEAGIWPQVQPVWGGCVWGGAGLTLSSSANWATRLWPHFCCWNSCLLSGQVFREGRGGAQVVLESQRLP